MKTMQENIALTHDIEQSSIRELSLDEVEAVGGGFSWGGLAKGIVKDVKSFSNSSFAKDVSEGAFTGAAGGAVAGLPEGGIGAVPGAAAGLLGGAATGAATWLAGKLGF
jgi:hypothetical protein